MKYKVDGWNNFCRVFELPKHMSTEFCFHRGVPIVFSMVDWFYPVKELHLPGVSKEKYIDKLGTYETVEIDLEELEAELIPYLKQKRYMCSGRRYIIVYEFGAVSYFEYT